MLKLYFFHVLAAAIVISSCTKERPRLASNLPDDSSMPAVGASANSNRNIVVFAGATTFVYQPETVCQLNGLVEGVEEKPPHVLWRKISGPEQGTIETPESLHTQVNNLATGVYSYQLSVRSASGNESADTVKVIVGRVGFHEVSFNKLHWIHPWYESLEISNIYKYVPQDKVIRVYVRRTGSAEWQEAYPFNTTDRAKYEFFIESRPYGAGMYGYGGLYIFYYGTDTNDTPDVKIVY